jgi:orotate phosphoribosyltransferase
MNKKIPLNERIALEILNAKAVDIRDVDNGEKPFLYASGNWGPGYVSVKNLVGRKAIIKLLAQNLAIKISEKAPNLDFIAGNVTGGVIPAWLLSEYLGAILGRTVPFVYIRETRKKGGQKELITGIKDNPEIPSGANGLVVEELVNFAQTTCNGADALREVGYEVTNATCILFYNNPEAIKALQAENIEMVYLITLPQLLEVAEKHKTHSAKAINSYRDFLKDPLGWQAKRGLEPVKEGGTK